MQTTMTDRERRRLKYQAIAQHNINVRRLGMLRAWMIRIGLANGNR